MFCVKSLEHVGIGGFQCVKSGHTPYFRKTRPDARTWAEKEDASGETRTYGNPNCGVISCTFPRILHVDTSPHPAFYTTPSVAH